MFRGLSMVLVLLQVRAIVQLPHSVKSALHPKMCLHLMQCVSVSRRGQQPL